MFLCGAKGARRPANLLACRIKSLGNVAPTDFGPRREISRRPNAALIYPTKYTATVSVRAANAQHPLTGRPNQFWALRREGKQDFGFQAKD